VAHSLETQLITRPQGSGSMTCLDADPNDLMVSPAPIPCPLPAIPTTHHRIIVPSYYNTSHRCFVDQSSTESIYRFIYHHILVSHSAPCISQTCKASSRLDSPSAGVSSNVRPISSHSPPLPRSKLPLSDLQSASFPVRLGIRSAASPLPILSFVFPVPLSSLPPHHLPPPSLPPLFPGPPLTSLPRSLQSRLRLRTRLRRGKLPRFRRQRPVL